MADPNPELGISFDLQVEVANAVADAQIDAWRQTQKDAAAAPAVGEDPYRQPPPVIRGLVLAQCGWRRKMSERNAAALGWGEEEMAPKPRLGLALYMCRRMRRPEWVDFPGEALLVAGLVCAQQHATPKAVQWYYDLYAPPLGKGHRVSLQLAEKAHQALVELAEALEAELCARLGGDDLARKMPGQLHAEVRRVEALLAASQQHVLDDARALVREHVDARELHFLGEVRACETLSDAKLAEANCRREFGMLPKAIEAALARMRQQRISFLEAELGTRWQYPLEGPLPPFVRAAKKYVQSLPQQNQSLQRFLGEVHRLKKQHTAQCEHQMEDAKRRVREVRDKVDTAKIGHLRKVYEEELAQLLASNHQLADTWLHLLGPDDALLAGHLGDILSPRTKMAKYASELEAVLQQARDRREEKEEFARTGVLADHGWQDVLTLDEAVDAVTRVRTILPLDHPLQQQIDLDDDLQQDMRTLEQKEDLELDEACESDADLGPVVVPGPTIRYDLGLEADYEADVMAEAAAFDRLLKEGPGGFFPVECLSPGQEAFEPFQTAMDQVAREEPGDARKLEEQLDADNLVNKSAMKALFNGAVPMGGRLEPPPPPQPLIAQLHLPRKPPGALDVCAQRFACAAAYAVRVPSERIRVLRTDRGEHRTGCSPVITLEIAPARNAWDPTAGAIVEGLSRQLGTA